MLAVCGASPAGAADSWRALRLPAPAHGSFSTAEPGVVYGRRLAIVDAASANAGVLPTFWLTRDAGRHWAPIVGMDPSGAATGDADGAIGADGRLYTLNLAYSPNPPGQPANPTVFVFRSSDGARWEGPAAFPAPHGSDQPDRPWLAPDPHHPNVVVVVNSEGAGNIVAWRSTDSGASFAGPYAVTSGANSQAALALSSRPLFDPTAAGRVFVLYETASALGSVGLLQAGTPIGEFPLTQLWLAKSDDDGLTWTSSEVLDAGAPLGHLLVASAIDRRGRLYAAYSLRAGGGNATSIELIHSADHGTKWSAPVTVPARTSSNVMPALAVSGTGAAYLSWYGSGAHDYRASDARWAEFAANILNPLATHPSFHVVQLSGATPVHVGGIDTAGTVGSDAGANWGLRDFQSITVDSCGRPHAVWASDNGTMATWIAVRRSRCR